MLNSKKMHLWECSLCGALIEQEDAPDFCPLCEHESVFFIKQEDDDKENKEKVEE